MQPNNSQSAHIAGVLKASSRKSGAKRNETNMSVAYTRRQESHTAGREGEAKEEKEEKKRGNTESNANKKDLQTPTVLSTFNHSAFS